MANKYKLLRDLPCVKAGAIIQSDMLYTFEYNQIGFTTKTIKNNPEWFAPYMLTTEDGVKIFKGESAYCIFENSQPIFQPHIFLNITEGEKYFSTKEKAQEYLDSLKPKYKVGDIVTYEEWIEHENRCVFTTFKIKELSDFVYSEDDNIAYQYGHLRLATEEEKEQYLKPKFKVGDIVVAYGKKVTKITKIDIYPQDAECSFLDEQIRKATSAEIISYYEQQGWVKGAKFKYGEYKGIVDNLEYVNNELIRIHHTSPIGASWCNLLGCELLKEPNYPKSFEELPNVLYGYWVNEDGTVRNQTEFGADKDKAYNMCAEYKQAESVLAYYQLTYLHQAMLDEYNIFHNSNWVPEFNMKDFMWRTNKDKGEETRKWVVNRRLDNLVVDFTTTRFQHLCFPDKKSAEFSLQYHRALWETYYEL